MQVIKVRTTTGININNNKVEANSSNNSSRVRRIKTQLQARHHNRMQVGRPLVVTLALPPTRND